MDFYNLWLHHRCVCVFLHVPFFTAPAFHEFVLQGGNEMRAPPQSLLFHKVRQGASGREMTCQWFTQDPQNAAVSLSSVQKWLWVFWLWLVWQGSLFTQFVKSLIENLMHTEPCLQPQWAFLPCVLTLYCHLFCVTDSVDFISPFQRTSLQLNASLMQGGLLWFLDSPRIKYGTQIKGFISDFFFLTLI